MSASVPQFLKRWAITTLAVLVAANVVRGIQYDSFTSLLVASALLGFLNAFARPLILALSLPLLLATLGLLLPVINALLLWFVGSSVSGFHVNGFWPAFWGALVISIVSVIGGLLLGGTVQSRVKVRHSNPRRREDDDGPVIDV
jgi:putative membrane protein